MDRAKRVDTHWKSVPPVETNNGDGAEPEEEAVVDVRGVTTNGKRPKRIEEDDVDELAQLRRAGEKIRREHRRQKVRPANPDGSAPKSVLDYLPHASATLRKLTARKQQALRDR